MSTVKIYTSLGCGYCSRAKHLFSSLEIPYEEIHLWNQPELAEKLREQYQWTTVPMIFIGDEFIGGYDDLVRLHQTGMLKTKIQAIP